MYIILYSVFREHMSQKKHIHTQDHSLKTAVNWNVSPPGPPACLFMQNLIAYHYEFRLGQVTAHIYGGWPQTVSCSKYGECCLFTCIY